MVKKDPTYDDGQITEKLKDMPGWWYEDGWIRRTYKTDGWPTTLMLVNLIGYLAEAAYHHPDLTVTWGRVIVKLQNHAAFHTPLLTPISEHARGIMDDALFKHPDVPLIDGRGAIWSPNATDRHAIWSYTLGHQVHRYYDFTKAVQVGVKEFAPDCVIILGPGATLGGAVAQSLIGINWQGWQSKEDFAARQKADPYILAMGMEDQRRLAVD